MMRLNVRLIAAGLMALPVSIAAPVPAASAQTSTTSQSAVPPTGVCKALAVHRINARVQTIASLEQSTGFAASLARASGKPAAPESDAAAKAHGELAAATQLLLALGSEQGVMPTELTGEMLRGGSFDVCMRSFAARGRRIDGPGRWAILTTPDSVSQIAFDEASVVRSGDRASYVSAMRLPQGESTSQGPTRFALNAWQITCSAAPTQRPMMSVYLKPGSAMAWRAIDTSIGNQSFSATAKGSAAEQMAQLACGTVEFDPETAREPSLEAIMKQWNN